MSAIIRAHENSWRSKCPMNYVEHAFTHAHSVKWTTGQKMGFLTIGNVVERWVLDDIADNNPTYRIHDIS